MTIRRLIFTAATWLVIVDALAGGQAPQAPGAGAGPVGTPAGRAGFSAKAPEAAARIAGRVLAADTGKPLRRATVTLMALPTKTIRIAVTDGDGRYEFSELPAGRYSVRPAKEGYVTVGENPFAAGLGLDLTDGQNADRSNFLLPKGSVITGRVTDEFGEPIAGVIVQAARYQFRPSGQRQLIMGSSGNFFMPAGTNDLGEFRIFGLRPGSYFVSARPDTAGSITISPSGAGGVSGVDADSGLTTTYYPGTANVNDAQTVAVELMRETNASFSLVPSRMARISGTVRDSQGRPVSTATLISLRPHSRTGIVGWFGNSNNALGPNGSFSFANVAPGDYILEIRPAPAEGAAAQAREYASSPLTVTGDDIPDLEVVTKSGISVSGRVIFEGKSAIAQPNLRISAASEEAARNVVGYVGPDGSQVAPDGRFHIPSVFGRVIFRPGFLPLTAILKSVTLNGVDITNTPFDTAGAEDIDGLEIVLTDKPSRIFGVAKNLRGEIQYNYRLVVYPANLKEGDVTIRYQHNTSPNNKGQFNAGRMPPGEYVGLAVKGVQPGEEWDPDLRRRIEQFGKRFTLQEGEALELEMPYVE